jgi:branched-chain amino acid transport system substrate-binding protein
VRPIVKIGLIAPFEGLYRESGYAALEAMRQAIQECTPPGIDVLPLALDDSGNPAQAQRAAQKLLVDPSVRAVVGPLLLESIPAVAAAISHTAISHTVAIPWIVPPLATPEGGFDAPASTVWLEAQTNFVATHTSAKRVLLLGLPTELHEGWQEEFNAAVPALPVDDVKSVLATLREDDALLWLGPPDEGARWLATLQETHPTVNFWLAVQAGVDIFAAHYHANPEVNREAHPAADNADRAPLHWLHWTNSDYNHPSQSDEPATDSNHALRELTYRATCAALATLSEGSHTSTAHWQLQERRIVLPESR